MSQEVADRVRGTTTIVVNNTFRLAPWAEMLFGADAEWWQYTPDAHQFAGLKVSVSSVKGVHRLRSSGTEGFDPDPSAVRTGGNSGYQAVHIAAHAGATRILLCGFDMHGKDHWHEPHQAPLRNTNPESYPKWIQRFATLAVALEARGVEVLNCTGGSALSCCQFVPLEEALARAESPAAVPALP